MKYYKKIIIIEKSEPSLSSDILKQNETKIQKRYGKITSVLEKKSKHQFFED